jgi:hypothetical protein
VAQFRRRIYAERIRNNFGAGHDVEWVGGDGEVETAGCLGWEVRREGGGSDRKATGQRPRLRKCTGRNRVGDGRHGLAARENRGWNECSGTAVYKNIGLAEIDGVVIAGPPLDDGAWNTI